MVRKGDKTVWLSRQNLEKREGNVPKRTSEDGKPWFWGGGAVTISS